MLVYPVVETFHSLQGEGYWVGANAFFIRLAGCDVGCAWCDTKISWSEKKHPKIPVSELVRLAREANPQFVVITGGEPLMHNLAVLTEQLQAENLAIHLETSGAHELTGVFDWITLSPKTFKPPLPDIYALANELKVVIAKANDLDWAEAQAKLVHKKIPLFLQPEWNNPVSHQLVMDYIYSHPKWRLSLQTHKLLGIR